MLNAARGIEFSFNNNMNKQLDRVAMGRTLGLALATTFVGFHESRLFDDGFVIIGSELNCDHLEKKLKLLHPALKFTIEMEQNNSLHFLDVVEEKEGTGLLTSIYNKLPFTGQYIR